MGLTNYPPPTIEDHACQTSDDRAKVNGVRVCDVCGAEAPPDYREGLIVINRGRPYGPHMYDSDHCVRECRPV